VNCEQKRAATKEEGMTAQNDHLSQTIGNRGVSISGENKIERIFAKEESGDARISRRTVSAPALGSAEEGGQMSRNPIVTMAWARRGRCRAQGLGGGHEMIEKKRANLPRMGSACPGEDMGSSRWLEQSKERGPYR